MQVSLEDADLVDAAIEITAISHSPELEALCVTTSEGHILLLDPVTRQFEEVRLLL